MFLPCVMQVLCTTWYIQVDMFRILMPFVSGINRQDECCLSLAWILTSKYQSTVDDRTKIECASNVVDVMEYSALNHHIVLQWKINKIASWMSLKSSVINNYSWIISAVLISPFLLLLLPSMLSIDCQTNLESVGIDSEDFLWFSRIEPLHPLLVVLVENDEEDGLLSSKLRTLRESDSVVQYQSNSLRSSEWCSMNSLKIFVFCKRNSNAEQNHTEQSQICVKNTNPAILERWDLLW